ncbi:hypothetical protein SESBI_28306 [Sesbania bispinosa]|nr:hypothetical protein SESBI_28306 [Sesbania bispinosa]
MHNYSSLAQAQIQCSPRAAPAEGTTLAPSRAATHILAPPTLHFNSSVHSGAGTTAAPPRAAVQAKLQLHRQHRSVLEAHRKGHFSAAVTSPAAT